MKVYDTKAKSNMNSISLNLKNIILSFLPLDESIQIFYMTKSFINAFKQTKIFGMVESGGLTTLLNNCTILRDKYFHFAKEFYTQYFDTHEEFKLFMARTLNKKFRKQQSLKLNGLLLNTDESAEIIRLFMKTNNNIKELTLHSFNIKSKNIFLQILTKKIFKNENIHSIKFSGNNYTSVSEGELKNIYMLLRKILIYFPFLKSIEFPGCLHNVKLNTHFSNFCKEIQSFKFLKDLEISIINPDNLTDLFPIIQLIESNKVKKLNLDFSSQLSNQEEMKIIADAVKQNESITALKLKTNLLNPLEAAEFVDNVLKENKTINEIDLSKNFFGTNPQAMEILKNAFKDRTSLEILNLKENSFGLNEFALITLADILSSSNLRILDLSFNGLYYSFNILCNAIGNSKSLLDVNLRSTGLAEYELLMQNLETTFSKNQSIKRLDLSFNFIGSRNQCLQNLINIISINRSLEDINLTANCLGECFENIKPLSEAIANNKNIKKLNLSQNNICELENGLSILIEEGLLKNSSIESLDLSSNGFQKNEMSILHLKEYLIKTSNLEELKISNEKFKRSAAEIILNAIAENNSLETLDLFFSNLFTNSEFVSIFENGLVEKNKTLKKIKVGALDVKNLLILDRKNSNVFNLIEI